MQKKVESIAVENHVNHVAKVVLEIGEVSTVVPSYLEDCWKWKCTKSEILKRLCIGNRDDPGSYILRRL